MKFKLDENLSRHLKPVLTDLGHDVLTAADEGLLSFCRTLRPIDGPVWSVGMHSRS